MYCITTCYIIYLSVRKRTWQSLVIYLEWYMLCNYLLYYLFTRWEKDVAVLRNLLKMMLGKNVVILSDLLGMMLEKDITIYTSDKRTYITILNHNNINNKQKDIQYMQVTCIYCKDITITTTYLFLPA